MAIQIVMDRTGDTRHEFDVAELRRCGARGGTLPAADRQRLPRRGAERRRQPGKLVDKFDPHVEQTLFIPQLQGG